MNIFRVLSLDYVSSSSTNKYWTPITRELFGVVLDNNINATSSSLSLVILNKVMSLSSSLEDEEEYYKYSFASLYIALTFSDASVLSFKDVAVMADREEEELMISVAKIMNLLDAKVYLPTLNFYISCLEKDGVIGGKTKTLADVLCLICHLHNYSYNYDQQTLAKAICYLCISYSMDEKIDYTKQEYVFVKECVDAISGEYSSKMIEICRDLADRIPLMSIQYPDRKEIVSIPKVSNMPEVEFAYHLGSGGYGSVDLVVSEAGFPYARKTQIISNEFIAEIALLSQLKHENVVSMISFSFGPEGVILMTPAQKTLTDEIYKNFDGDSTQRWYECFDYGKPPSEITLLRRVTRRYYLEDIYKGLSYIHSLGIIHRDIKPGNILIENGIARIADFGLSRLYTTTLRDDDPKQAACFTTAYRPPELISALSNNIHLFPYSYEVDIWSFGVVILEMETSCLFSMNHGKGNLETIFKVLGSPPKVYPYTYFPHYPSRRLECVSDVNLRRVITSFLSLDPKKRGKLSELDQIL